MPAREFNFDGIVGPTHHYAGLAPGNLASQQHQHQPSNPKAAALQGLAKMRFVHSLGVAQAVLPPQLRPDVDYLRRLGFTGDDAAVLLKAHRDAPHLLAVASSASCMWTANAATVAPSTDTADGKTHFTPANLIAAPHRQNETTITAATLKQVFADEQHFTHHSPLPSAQGLGDEGAANHTRLSPSTNAPGVHLFVHGDPHPPAKAIKPAPEEQSDEGPDPTPNHPQRFRPRQNLGASQAVARLHRLNPDRTVFAQQHPAAIDAGVFHNDVIAVGHGHTLLYHEHAFADESATIRTLENAWKHAVSEDNSKSLRFLRVTDAQLPLHEAVATYLFNSQLLRNGTGQLVLVAPSECEQHPAARAVLDGFIERGDLDAVHFVDVRQSMNNGGGPACLRLRVVLTEPEQAAINQHVLFTGELDTWLTAWIEKHYRDHLTADDLADPELLRTNRDAHHELMQRLGLDFDETS